MKSVIVYYSLTGNTAWTARRLADALHAELLELRPCKAYPDRGVKKFFWGGKSAMMGERPALEPYPFDAAQYDCVVLATPLWAGRIAPPLRTFLDAHGSAIAGKRIGAVICSGGGNDAKAFAQIGALLGDEPLATLRLVEPKDKPENEKAMTAFCKRLTDNAAEKEETT